MVVLLVCRYESGDHVAVFPTNEAALVNRLGQVLEADLDTVISLNNLDGMALIYSAPWLNNVNPQTNHDKFIIYQRSAVSLHLT